jgi:hypothetical protein
MQPNQALLQFQKPEATDQNARARVGRLNNKSITKTNLWPLRDQGKIRGNPRNAVIHTRGIATAKKDMQERLHRQMQQESRPGYAEKRTILKRHVEAMSIMILWTYNNCSYRSEEGS